VISYIRSSYRAHTAPELVISYICIRSSYRAIPVRLLDSSIRNDFRYSLAFNFQVQAILHDYKLKKSSKEEFLSKADRLLSQYTKIPDKRSFDKLMAIYIPLDEARIAVQRAEKRKLYLAEVERHRQAELAKKREAERQAAAKRKLEEEMRKERERVAELERIEKAKRAKEQRELKIYQAYLNKKKDKLRFQFVEFCTKHQFKQAYKILQAAKSERNKVIYESTLKVSAAERFIQWLENLQKTLKKCEELYNLFNNSGTKLAGKQIEKNYKLYTIKSINNGIATITKPSTEDEGLETVHVSLESFGRAFSRFFNREVKRLGIKDASFYYYLAQGYFQYKMVPPNNFWVEELPKLKYQYFKQKYASASAAERRRLRKVYGKLYSFKRATR